MIVPPNLNCVTQELQQFTRRKISSANKISWYAEAKKFVGIGNPDSFNFTITTSGFTTQYAQKHKSLLADISINCSYSGLLCGDSEQKNLYYNARDEIINIIKARGSSYNYLTKQESETLEGQTKLSETIVHNYEDASEFYQIRLYEPVYPTDVILKYSLSASQRNYTFYIQYIK